MTDQEKNELREAIEIVKTLALSEDFDIDREKAEMIIIKAAKKLLDASESLPSELSNASTYNKRVFNEGHNKCLSKCTSTVSAHYVSKNDLPSEKEIYDELMDTFINSDIDDVPDGLLEKTAKVIYERIIGGK